MRQQSFRHRGGKGSGIGGGILVVMAVVAGVFVVYHLILWFRSSSAKTIADSVNSTSDISVVDATSSRVVQLNATAALRTTDGATVGTFVRSGTLEAPSYSLVATLPALAPDLLYEVWFVKDGLADVQSVGTLNIRADGSWAGVFTLRDPLEYPTVVIMLEPTDGNAGPSGNRVAEGTFE